LQPPRKQAPARTSAHEVEHQVTREREEGQETVAAAPAGEAGAEAVAARTAPRRLVVATPAPRAPAPVRVVTVARARQGAAGPGVRLAGSRRLRPPVPPARTPAASAAAAQLRYVSDCGPGLARCRRGRGFAYVDAEGRPVRDPATRRRIAALAIPPAWRDVWICPHPEGHIQAVGRDARGRKQYRYHPRWRAVRDETKYARLLAFGRVLPLIRARVAEDLARPGLPRAKVLGTVVRLLETTLIRIGNPEYARQNRSFGLTTLRSRQVKVTGAIVRFEFRGKAGRQHTVDVEDRRLAAIVKRCRDLPGHELFQYLDEDGEPATLDSGDVNAYLREITAQDFTAKDFRTWAGTVLAARCLGAAGDLLPEPQRRRAVVQAVAEVARQLGNTPTVCRACYIHPGVVQAFLEGSLAGRLREARGPGGHGGPESGLRPDEAAVLALLEDAERAAPLLKAG
jgi:DNA topoisomerase-1